MQLANYILYPLQIPLILAFVRLGERCVGAAPIPFPRATGRRLPDDPLAFLARFGRTGLHGVLGWLAMAPLVAGALHLTCSPCCATPTQSTPGGPAATA